MTKAQRPKIAFDLRWIVRDRGGVATHALNLLRALLVQGEEFEMVALVHPVQKRMLMDSLSALVSMPEILVSDASALSLSGQVALPAELVRSGFMILHSPNYLGLMLSNRLRSIVTVHDLMAFLFPERCPKALAVRYRPLFKLALQRSLTRADAILADSQTTAADISRAFPDCSSKVEIVHSAVDPIFFASSDSGVIRQLRDRYAKTGYLVLFVGRRDPNKNLVPLIRAVAALRAGGLDVHLAVAGIKDERYPEPEEAVRELGIGPHVHFLGFVENATLAALYHAADALAFPSSYEGFGLPPLEAMASGTPVVTARCASIPDVVADAAEYVLPDQPESIARGVKRVLIEAGLRERLAQKGRERARHFTWEDAASRVLGVYRHLVSPGCGHS